MITEIAIMIVTFDIGCVIGFWLARTLVKSPVAPEPVSRLDQQNFDFWYAECCRLHTLATDAFKWDENEKFLGFAIQHEAAFRRFQSAAEQLA